MIRRNTALLGKWLWRFPKEQDSLWYAVIESKYGINKNGWDSKVEFIGSLRAPWKAISKGWQTFVSCTEIKVGCGDRTQFWLDNWVRGRSLKELFPRLFQLSNNKNAMVSDVAKWGSDSNVTWDLTFARNFNDWEIEDFAALIETVHNTSVNRNRADVRIWKKESSGEFSCRSYFHSLCQSTNTSYSFPQFNMIWKGGIPSKVKVFAWLAYWNRVNTCEVIQRKRPYMAISPSRCILCCNAAENIDHLLLHCKFTQEIWNRIFLLFSCVGAINRRWADFILVKWHFRKNNKKTRSLWRFLILATMWHVWLERNRRIFEDRCKSIDEVWCSIKSSVGLWARASRILDQTENFLFSLDCLSFFVEVA